MCARGKKYTGIQSIKKYSKTFSPLQTGMCWRNLYQWVKKLSELLRFLAVLFIIDDIIANEGLDNRRQPLLELSISGRHRGHYLWLLTQSYSAISKNLRRQAKAIFVWYPKERADLKIAHDENDVLTNDELVVARNFFKMSKHVCVYI